MQNVRHHPGATETVFILTRSPGGEAIVSSTDHYHLPDTNNEHLSNDMYIVTLQFTKHVSNSKMESNKKLTAAFCCVLYLRYLIQSSEQSFERGMGHSRCSQNSEFDQCNLFRMRSQIRYMQRHPVNPE